eukprot:TRINITY_DN10981_c0_g2_i1.p1 TRINITY_DN10981_c0_g2~~TRINITY_DN10981_c0_g2_i1.p1  ORF type:complete len:650 (+),score=104.41 TRINITY_DN10981_c0_g2_i1:50-1999(+)
MPKQLALFFAVSVLVAQSAEQEHTVESLLKGSGATEIPDPHSCSNHVDVSVTHLHPKLQVDFERRYLSGNVSIYATVWNHAAAVLSLDVAENLHVTGVFSRDDTSMTWTTSDAAFGKCLQVEISSIISEKKDDDSRLLITVSYEVTDPAGVGWLTAEQTSSGQPMMYTQFQAILARTVLPCQDTPSVKASFDLSVTVPEPLVAVASASVASPPITVGVGFRTFEFFQPTPVMAYLVAFAVGALERAELGPSSSVWAEKNVLQRAQAELRETERYVEISSKLLDYDYIWGSFDILVLPASFPYGGMENPNLMFLNACLLGGELLNVVIHEVTHSWVGNLVTNALWKDFWLNEGFAVYVERLVLGELEGEGVRGLHAAAGRRDLEKAVEMFVETPEWTKLRADLSDVDPDEAFSKVPYEKGFLLLLHLESLAGQKEMLTWLQGYVRNFAGMSITTDAFLDSFKGSMPDIAAKVDWGMWLDQPGVPAWRSDDYLNGTLIEETTEVASCWLTATDSSCPHLGHPFQKIQMVQNFRALGGGVVGLSSLKLLQEELHVGSANVELQFQWLCLCFEQENAEAFELVRDLLGRFLGEVGRFAYVRELFTKLWTLAELGIVSKHEVREVAATNRRKYHSVVTHFLDGLLASTHESTEL